MEKRGKDNMNEIEVGWKEREIMENRIADKKGREEQQMGSKGEQFEVEGRII